MSTRPVSDSAPPSSAASNAADARVLAGVCIVLMLVVLRCFSPFDPFPWWSGDPLESPGPVMGITPAASLWIDAATLVGCAIAVLGMTRAELRRWAVCAGVSVVAAWVVGVHARRGAGLDNLVLGSTWVTAFLGASTFFACAGRAMVRRVVIATLLGAMGMLTVRAVTEVWIEHPRTVETFRLTREQFFRSQGWTPDSPMAKAFERRLFQSEASGYFGMANVLATLGAASAVICGGLLAQALRSTLARPTWVMLGLMLGTVGSVVCVVLAGAKGGYASLVGGCVLMAMGWWVARRAGPRAVHGGGLQQFARFLGPLCILAALCAVIVRGQLGDRLGELSILFRWHYMQAATRIIAEQPLLGTGPMGFKDAYLLAKNPLSPEEVNSPHCLVLDLPATLGIAGAALALLWCWWASLAGTGVLRQHEHQNEHAAEPEPLSPAREGRLLALVLVLPTALAVALERDGMVPEVAIGRLLGCGAAVWVAAAVARWLRDGPAARAQVLPIFVPLAAGPLAAGCCALAAHCQIELTGITPGASAWCAALLAVGAGGSAARTRDRGEPVALRAGLTLRMLAVAMVVLCGAALVAPAAGTMRWQQQLKEAYAMTAQAGEFSARRNALAQRAVLPGFEGDSAGQLAKDLGAALGTSVATTPDGIDKALALQRLGAVEGALAILAPERGTALPTRFPHHIPPHFPTLRATSRLCLNAAQLYQVLGNTKMVSERIDQGRGALARGESTYRSASYWAWRGTFEQSVAQIDARQRDVALRAALTHWAQAAELGPSELLPARKSAEVSLQLGDATSAKVWAKEALRRHELLALDTLEQLTPAQVAEYKSLLSKD
jgi:hypothetical protein